MSEFNPFKATEKAHRDYFSFFQASFSPNNPELANELEKLKEREYIWKEPYISISQPFQEGSPLDIFVENHDLSPQISKAFSYIKKLYSHQEEAIKNILKGRHTIVASGTGSGKTEVFFIPIIDYLIKNRGQKGVKALIIYPMNALVNDQVERLRRVLFTVNKYVTPKITFASYTGYTPQSYQDLPKEYEICPEPSCGKSLYPDQVGDHVYLRCERNRDVIIDYQLLTREDIRRNPPDILITNYVQLEYLLLRKADSALFDANTLKFIVLDEIHTYTGARGIDVAFLIRRLKRRVDPENRRKLVFIGTSATLSSRKDEKQRRREIAEFASQLFGEVIREDDVFEGKYEKWNFPKPIILEKLEEIDIGRDIDNLNELKNEEFIRICKKLDPNFTPPPYTKNRALILGQVLITNPFFQKLLTVLNEPKKLDEIVDYLITSEELDKVISPFRGNRNKLKDIIWQYLKLGSLAAHPYLSEETTPTPLIRVNVHNFFKTIEDLYICHNCGRIFISPRDKCDSCYRTVDKLGVCRFCGEKFYISRIRKSDFSTLIRHPVDSEIIATIGETVTEKRIRKLPYNAEELDAVEIWQTYKKVPEKAAGALIISRKKCLQCGSFNLLSDEKCYFCGSDELRQIYIILRSKVARSTQPVYCPFCNNSYGRFSALSSITMSPSTAGTTLFDIIYTELPRKYRKLLIFTDNKQVAAYLAGYLEIEHRTHIMRRLIYEVLKDEFNGRCSYSELKEAVMSVIRGWYGGNFEGFFVREEDILLEFTREISSSIAAQRSLENLGLIEITYDVLENDHKFKEELEKEDFLPAFMKNDLELLRCYFIAVLNKIRQAGALKGLEKKRYFEKGNVVGYSLYPRKLSQKGITVKGLMSKGGAIFKLTKRAFNVDNDNASEIIKRTFDFLVKKGLLIRTELRKGKRREEAYVVNSAKIIVKIPKIVLKCPICKRIYCNAPRNVCLTWRCNGTLEEVDYEKHLLENSSFHYISIYTTRKPTRMVTAEDTGALDLAERRKIETEFKSDLPEERKVDVIVATPTLELGVDIGDLISIGLFKAPPAPVNYVQRVGRAGRRTGISFNNTFFFLNPIDMYYYHRPYELIRGEILAPVINTKNRHMLKRHVNALILEDVLVFSSIADYISHNMGNFIESRCDELILSEVDKRKKQIVEKIKTAFKDVILDMNDQEIEAFLDYFKKDLSYSVQVWKEELNRYERYLKQLANQMVYKSMRERRSLEIQSEKIQRYLHNLEDKSFLQHGMDSGLLPRYAFPGIYVDVEEEFGREQFSGQCKSYAITEYAPGMEITLKKGVYESVGIDFKFTKPKVVNYYVCRNCNIYIAEGIEPPDKCPLCHTRNFLPLIESISPEVIYLKKSPKPINEPREYREPLLDIFLKIRTIEPIDTRSDIDNFFIKRYGNIEIVQIVRGIWHENESEPRLIELCEKCGRVRRSQRETTHIELGGMKKCDGRFKPFNLFHSMPTNVISIQVRGDTLFGVKVDGNDQRFLTTLKNAIINAAQIILNADDGEIEGVVKGNELLLYDNIEGGAGYVDEIFKRFEEILQMAADIVLNPEDDCEHGCLKCLYSYRRKRDIPYIDKRLIKPFLERVKSHYTDLRIKQKGKQKITYTGSKIVTIHSPDYDLTGAIELKDILRTAQQEIKIISLYVTDDKNVSWPDEGRKSWVDILRSIRLDKDKNVRITVIVREPSRDIHRKALKKLIEDGIEVLVFKEELEKAKAIAHEKLIVVDPLNPQTRYAVHTSANFSVTEMWKNKDFYDFGRDEEWVKGTYREILEVEKKSKRLELKDVLTAEGFSSIVLTPGRNAQELTKLGYELAKAKEEVCIMDPYLTRTKEIFAYLTRWIKRGVKIRIITARVVSSELKKVLTDYRNKGFLIAPVLRYFDREKKTGKETILHDRYIIIDRNRVVKLGKGINTIIEAFTYEAKNNVIVDIIEIPSIVEQYVRNFEQFWNYENIENKVIREFPKEVY